MLQKNTQLATCNTAKDACLAEKSTLQQDLGGLQCGVVACWVPLCCSVQWCGMRRCALLCGAVASCRAELAPITKPTSFQTCGTLPWPLPAATCQTTVATQQTTISNVRKGLGGHAL